MLAAWSHIGEISTSRRVTSVGNRCDAALSAPAYPNCSLKMTSILIQVGLICMEKLRDEHSLCPNVINDDKLLQGDSGSQKGVVEQDNNFYDLNAVETEHLELSGALRASLVNELLEPGGWNDENNSITDVKFVMVKTSVIAIASCLLQVVTLKLFPEMVNGLDPPKGLTVSVGTSSVANLIERKVFSDYSKLQKWENVGQRPGAMSTVHELLSYWSCPGDQFLLIQVSRKRKHPAITGNESTQGMIAGLDKEIATMVTERK